MIGLLAAAVITVCAINGDCQDLSSEQTLIVTKPPCGTPEAKKEGDCQQWVVRRPPVQPADEWPPYEKKSGNLVDPFAPRPRPSFGGNIILDGSSSVACCGL